jgi:nicotinate-nucleotide adenylyltransferase
MAILILGAAFDPPHNGHMLMAEEMIKKGIASKVILMPCHNHPFAKNMSPAEERLALTKLAVEELRERVGDYFEVSTSEINREGASYAFDTLDEVAKQYPDETVGWLMGSDQLKDFSKWYKYEELLEKYPVYVYPRKGYPMEPLYPGMIEAQGVPLLETSSSEIRRRVEEGKEIGSMVAPSVAKYMEGKHNGKNRETR